MFDLTTPVDTTELTAAYATLARQALAAGVTVADPALAELAAFCAANAVYPASVHCCVVFGVACELADLYAQNAGYTDACARAWATAEARRLTMAGGDV